MTVANRLQDLSCGWARAPSCGPAWFALDERRQRVAALEAEVAALTRIGEETATAAEAEAEKARAEAGRKAAEAERLREALTGRCHGAPSIRFCS